MPTTPHNRAQAIQKVIHDWCERNRFAATREQELELFVKLTQLWVELSIEVTADEGMDFLKEDDNEHL